MDQQLVQLTLVQQKCLEEYKKLLSSLYIATCRNVHGMSRDFDYSKVVSSPNETQLLIDLFLTNRPYLFYLAHMIRFLEHNQIDVVCNLPKGTQTRLWNQFNKLYGPLHDDSIGPREEFKDSGFDRLTDSDIRTVFDSDNDLVTLGQVAKTYEILIIDRVDILK